MNLDWSVDTLDVRTFLAKGRFDTGLPATWGEGDFNYDGVADILDIADFMSSGLFNAGPYNTPAGTIAAVPEPSVTAFVAAGVGLLGIGALWRKRAAQYLRKSGTGFPMPLFPWPIPPTPDTLNGSRTKRSSSYWGLDRTPLTQSPAACRSTTSSTPDTLTGSGTRTWMRESGS
jgi:hypothetical protein